MKHATDKVVKLVKLVYNSFSLDIPQYSVIEYQVISGVKGGEIFGIVVTVVRIA